MIVNINGPLTHFYAQTLCLTVFPGATFSESEKPCREVPCVTFSLSVDGDVYHCTVDIEHLGKVYSGTSSLSSSEQLSRPTMVAKVCAGRAFMKAAEKYSGKVFPWGILTGVRPAKLALELLDAGKTEEECVDIFEREYSVSRRKALLAANVARAEKNLITQGIHKQCSLYIAIPFCPSRCSYCSFVSFTSKKLLSLIPEYIEVLLKEIKRISCIVKQLGITVSTIYIGGGTPTVLNEEQLERLLFAVSEAFDLSLVTEFTLEAGRPDTITKEKLACAKRHGVTRISVNTQTLNNEILASIGRAHTCDDFFAAYDMARCSGISDVNVDLIAGLPGESFESFARSVDGVVALRPENITVHTFCVKKSAEVKKKEDNIFLDDYTPAVQSVDYSQKVMNESGYFPYYMYRQKNARGNLENVGFSLPGREGLYNIYMMEEIQTIFALGASAVTKLVSFDEKGTRLEIKRLAENKYPFEYIAEKTSSDYNGISEENKRQIFEFFGK